MDRKCAIYNRISVENKTQLEKIRNIEGGNEIMTNASRIINNEIRNFDNFLKSNYSDFYNDIRLKHRFINWNQRTNFIFSQSKHNLLSKLADKIENRESRRND